MRVFDEQISKLLQDEEARKRIHPWLTDTFDPLVLDRPTFLDEVGLQQEDGPLLRAGAAGQKWLQTPLFARALAEEIEGSEDRFLGDYPTMKEDKQWQIAQKVYLRMNQLVLMRDQAEELGTTSEQMDAWRREWKDHDDHQIALAIQMLLLGIGLKKDELLKRLQDQTTTSFLLVFAKKRPTLTNVSPEDAEMIVAWNDLAIRASMAKEMEENSKLGPELWSKQWLDYFKKHGKISNAELQAFLRHLEEGERYKWSHLVAGQGAKARRGVAAVCNALLESLASDTDHASIQKMLDLTQQFSERHEMESILKRRFGI